MLFKLNRLSKRPRLPSELLRLQAAGFSEAACLDVDLAFEEFDIWLSAREEETVEEPAPRESKPTVQRPKYRTLAQLIGMEDQALAKAFAVTDEEAALAEAIAAGSVDLETLLGGMPPP